MLFILIMNIDFVHTLESGEQNNINISTVQKINTTELLKENHRKNIIIYIHKICFV